MRLLSWLSTLHRCRRRRPPQRTSPHHKGLPQLEELEGRLTPATLVSPSKVTWRDVDGDLVTCKLSLPVLTSASIADNVFTFNTGNTSSGNTVPQILQSLHLFVLRRSAPGVSVTIQSTRVGTGDGFVNIGAIDAQLSSETLDLGAVVVDGDLGRIEAGDEDSGTPGLASLTVHSLGRFGTSNQAPGDTGLQSHVDGSLGSLTVAADVTVASVRVNGDIGSVTIRGSLIGGSSSFSGSIICEATLGSIRIRGSVIGGTNDPSGLIEGDTRVGSVLIKGDLVGGSDTACGAIFSGGDLGPVTIRGSVIGGTAALCGEIEADGKLHAVIIGGSLIGSSGDSSGRILGSEAIGQVLIRGNVVGNSGSQSGAILSDGNIEAVTVKGSVQSGSGAQSGSVIAGKALGTVLVRGSLVGNSARPVLIEGRGQDAPANGVDLAIASVFVGGRLEFAQILAGVSADRIPQNPDAQIGSVTVAGDCIASSIVAGIDPRDGKFGNNDDQVIATGDDPTIRSKIGSISIGGAVLGTLDSVTSTDSFAFEAQRITSLSLGGELFALAAGASNDDFFLGITRDFRVREL